MAVIKALPGPRGCQEYGIAGRDFSHGVISIDPMTTKATFLAAISISRHGGLHRRKSVFVPPATWQPSPATGVSRVRHILPALLNAAIKTPFTLCGYSSHACVRLVLVEL